MSHRIHQQAESPIGAGRALDPPAKRSRSRGRSSRYPASLPEGVLQELASFVAVFASHGFRQEARLLVKYCVAIRPRKDTLLDEVAAPRIRAFHRSCLFSSSSWRAVAGGKVRLRTPMATTTEKRFQTGAIAKRENEGRSHQHSPENKERATRIRVHVHFVMKDGRCDRSWFSWAFLGRLGHSLARLCLPLWHQKYL